MFMRVVALVLVTALVWQMPGLAAAASGSVWGGRIGRAILELIGAKEIVREIHRKAEQNRKTKPAPPKQKAGPTAKAKTPPAAPKAPTPAARTEPKTDSNSLDLRVTAPPWRLLPIVTMPVVVARVLLQQFARAPLLR